MLYNEDDDLKRKYDEVTRECKYSRANENAETLSDSA